MGDHIVRIVVRAVINYDQFEVCAALGQNAIDGSANGFSCIIYGQDNGN